MRNLALALSLASTLTACGTVDAEAQSDFQDQVETAGITPPQFGFEAYDGGIFLWSSQSAPDVSNPNQDLGARGTDTDRNWSWDYNNLTLLPLLDESGMAKAFGAQLGYDNTYLFTFATAEAVPGVDAGWAVGTEDTENWGYVFEAQECGRIVYDICLHVSADGTPSTANCANLYVAPDPCPNGYEEDTGE